MPAFEKLQAGDVKGALTDTNAQGYMQTGEVGELLVRGASLFAVTGFYTAWGYWRDRGNDGNVEQRAVVVEVLVPILPVRSRRYDDAFWKDLLGSKRGSGDGLKDLGF